METCSHFYSGIICSLSNLTSPHFQWLDCLQGRKGGVPKRSRSRSSASKAPAVLQFQTSFGIDCSTNTIQHYGSSTIAYVFTHSPCSLFSCCPTCLQCDSSCVSFRDSCSIDPVSGRPPAHHDRLLSSSCSVDPVSGRPPAHRDHLLSSSCSVYPVSGRPPAHCD